MSGLRLLHTKHFAKITTRKFQIFQIETWRVISTHTERAAFCRKSALKKLTYKTFAGILCNRCLKTFRRGHSLGILTAWSCDRIRLCLTSTTRKVQSSLHKAKPLSWIQNLGCNLRVKSLFTVSWIWTWSVGRWGPDCRSIGCQGAVSAAGWVMDRSRLMIVEHVFIQVLVIKRGVPRQVTGKRWSLRLNRSQTLILRPGTQIKIILAESLNRTVNKSLL